MREKIDKYIYICDISFVGNLKFIIGCFQQSNISVIGV